MTIFNQNTTSNFYIDSNNPEGSQRFELFLDNILSGGYPQELSGSWINLITKTEGDEESGFYTYQVFSLYFNNLHPEGTIIESDRPVMDVYPDEYPDAYISWGIDSYIVGEIYVKPAYRRSGVGTSLSVLAGIYIAGLGGEIKCPEMSNTSVSLMLSYLRKQYGQYIPGPRYLLNPSYVYTPFERIRYEDAEQLFGVDNV